MEPKLKIYVGDVNAGQKDGLRANTVKITTPAFVDTAKSYCLLFALRCDDGYRAENVSVDIVDSTGKDHIGSTFKYWYKDPKKGDSWILSGSIYTTDLINLPLVKNVNTVIMVDLYSISEVSLADPNFHIKISVGYAEFKEDE